MSTNSHDGGTVVNRVSKTWNSSVSCLWNCEIEEKIKSSKSNFNFQLFFVENYFLNDPEMNYELDTSYMSHKEKYEEAIRRATLAAKKVKKLQTEGRLGKDLGL